MLKYLAFAKFRIKWFCNNCLLSKLTTIGDTSFILAVFPASSRGSMNLVKVLSNTESSESFKWSGN